MNGTKKDRMKKKMSKCGYTQWGGISVKKAHPQRDSLRNLRYVLSSHD